MHSVLLWDWHCARRFFRNEFFLQDLPAQTSSSLLFTTCSNKRYHFHHINGTMYVQVLFASIILTLYWELFVPLKIFPSDHATKTAKFAACPSDASQAAPPFAGNTNATRTTLSTAVLSVRKSLHLVFDFRIVRVQQSSLSHMLMWCSMTTTEDWQLILGICPLYDTI